MTSSMRLCPGHRTLSGDVVACHTSVLTFPWSALKSTSTSLADWKNQSVPASPVSRSAAFVSFFTVLLLSLFVAFKPLPLSK